jgi:hypothetical protein
MRSQGPGQKGGGSATVVGRWEAVTADIESEMRVFNCQRGRNDEKSTYEQKTGKLRREESIDLHMYRKGKEPRDTRKLGTTRRSAGPLTLPLIEQPDPRTSETRSEQDGTWYHTFKI